ncbi:MAG: hypothetical protein RL240_4404 [Planctomycetota bacterium]
MLFVTVLLLWLDFEHPRLGPTESREQVGYAYVEPPSHRKLRTLQRSRIRDFCSS